VVVYFYPRDDTPGCTTQACGFRDRYLDIQEKNAVVLGKVDPIVKTPKVLFLSACLLGVKWC